MWSSEGDRPNLWNFETIVSLLIALPGIGMIIASFLVNNDSYEGQHLSFILLLLGSFFTLINGIVFALYFISNRKKVQLMQYGISGTARVLDFVEENRRINGRPVFKFKLEVNDGLNPVREVEHRKTIPLVKIASLKKNMIVRVKVHPDKPDRIFILLD